MNANQLKWYGSLAAAASLMTLTACPPGGIGGAGGTTGTGGATPQKWSCTCNCTDGQFNTGALPHTVCDTDPFSASSDCDHQCDADASAWGYSSCSHPPVTATEMICTPGQNGQSLSFTGDPQSTDVTLSGTSSTATITYYGQQVVVPVSGSVEFSGGCSGGPCLISFNQIALATSNFAVTDPNTGAQTLLTNVSLENVSQINTTQTSGSFTLSHTAVQMLVQGKVNGVLQALTFSPNQDVVGRYVPELGVFVVQGTFISGTSFGLQLSLVGSSSGKRPPIASAGPAQTFRLSSRQVLVNVTLDGSGSRDPDGNLSHIDWYEGATYLGRGTQLAHLFGRGTHTVTAKAWDATAKNNSATTTVTVQ